MTSPASGTDPSVNITAEGIWLSPDDDRIFDLLFDGRRIWSFRSEVGTTRPDRVGQVLVEWPTPLHGFLHGVAEVTVRTTDGVTLTSREIRFDDSAGRAAVVDIAGHPMVLDSKGRLSLPFDDAEALAPLLQSAHDVLDVLAQQGVAPFLAYGTLLGAVREGDFIGHDNDIDLGYVSEQSTPVDVIRESLRLERAMARAGMPAERYSGAGFKVLVRDGAGIARWVDVFGGFWSAGRLALMGELFLPFDRDWIYPLGEVELAGETFPAPARPERLLEAMYGPGWKVPDPTFAFESDTSARHRLNLWFRGIRQQRNQWDRHYSGQRHHEPPKQPHELARQLHETDGGAHVIDVACGRGRDAFWLAEQGHHVTALDFSAWGPSYLRTVATESGIGVDFHTVNLLELRHALGWGARLARIDGPKVMLARHAIDAMPPLAAEGFWRMAAMAMRAGGRGYFEFFAAPDPRPRQPEDLVWQLDPDRVSTQARAAGGRVVETTRHQPAGNELGWATAQWESAQTCRMVVEW